MTTTARRVSTQLRSLALIIENLERTLPNAVVVETDRLSTMDGWPARGESAGGRSSDSTSSTERTALARHRVTDGDGETTALDDVAEMLRVVTLKVSDLTKWANDRLPEVDTTPQRCSGGRPSIEDWTRPDCTNLVDFYTLASGETRPRGDGLCPACRKRKQRHERDVERHRSPT